MRADDVGHFPQCFRKRFGIVHLIDIRDVLLLLLLAGRVADIIHIETERLGQIIETV